MTISAQTPPTTDPVLERITQNIIGTLQTITIANGYSVDATIIQPNPGVGNPEKDGTILFVTGDASEETTGPETYNQWLQQFDVATLIVVSENAADPNIETLRNLRRAEIEWALTYDPVPSSRPNGTRGGLTEDTLIMAATVVDCPPDSHEAVLIVHIGVRYRTPYNNPFASIYD